MTHIHIKPALYYILGAIMPFLVVVAIIFLDFNPFYFGPLGFMLMVIFMRMVAQQENTFIDSQIVVIEGKQLFTWSEVDKIASLSKNKATFVLEDGTTKSFRMDTWSKKNKKRLKILLSEIGL